MKFGVVVVVDEPMPCWFDLRGLFWNHCCLLHKHWNIFHVKKFIFVMLRLEIAPDNVATNHFDLE